MQIPPKQLITEEFIYSSNKSVENLKEEIQKLINRNEGWSFKVNLTGRFISEYEFIFTPKWQIAIIRSFETSNAYLKGKIYLDENNKTCVKFTVRPNSIYPIFAVLFPLIGFVSIKNYSTGKGKVETILGLFLVIFFAPAISIIFAYYAKKSIKKEFVKAFNLKPV